MDSLAPPAPFLPTPGKPTDTWTAWELRFKTYLTAIGGDEFPAPRQKALLLHAVGAEAQKVHASQPVQVPQEGENDYEATMRQLRLYYTPQPNIIMERFRFRSCCQQPGQTTADYVAELRKHVRDCNFGPL